MENGDIFVPVHADDDNRIVLEPLPDEQSSDMDYVNAYAGDYINASYIDVSSIVCTCVELVSTN